ncbi:MAG TPA: P-II family nitrogen regulator [Candidatus Coproplasma avicola]|uniref:P-II family nitrogen regulator n=1 Tax=Candidatus Coproplasma avicola TaxID=2840744 RepID=A0A9D1E5C4_9FIRM|nr:P-II family nitrogen regulator [Candidatus Coproplasma avicola]
MPAYEAVFCIVNDGFSDVVMDAAREAGARGGTVIHARGTANKEAEKFFKITIQPEKEIVMILVPADIKDDVLRAIYRNAGLKTEGQGIAFSVAVDDVVGMSGEIPPVDIHEQTDDTQQEGAEK